MISKNTLAIDPATRCGWATNGECGVWDLSTRADESAGMKWLRFRAKLEEICNVFPIKVIAYERPGGHHTNAIIHHAKMVAIIEAFAEEHRIDYRAYSATEIKAFATGKGNSGKPAMIKAAQDKLCYTGEDDNEADALWILALLHRDLQIA